MVPDLSTVPRTEQPTIVTKSRAEHVRNEGALSVDSASPISGLICRKLSPEPHIALVTPATVRSPPSVSIVVRPPGYRAAGSTFGSSGIFPKSDGNRGTGLMGKSPGRFRHRDELGNLGS
jgi:hypothetical protein